MNTTTDAHTALERAERNRGWRLLALMVATEIALVVWLLL
jgi:hypothetical protein